MYRDQMPLISFIEECYPPGKSGSDYIYQDHNQLSIILSRLGLLDESPLPVNVDNTMDALVDKLASSLMMREWKYPFCLINELCVRLS